MKKLTDKVATVTGAGQGVGLGIALALAAEGTTLTITGRNEDKLRAAAELIRAQGAPDVLVVVGDARRRADAQNAVRATIARFGRLDVLVNNAQSTVTNVPFEDVDDATIAMILESGLLMNTPLQGRLRHSVNADRIGPNVSTAAAA